MLDIVSIFCYNIYKIKKGDQMDIQTFYKIYDQYCLFKNPVTGFALMTKDEFDEMCYWDEVHQAEQDAENAWLVHAERTTNDDIGFEQHERNMGVVPFSEALSKGELSGQHFCSTGDIRRIRSGE
jgi:hypothetical protein